MHNNRLYEQARFYLQKSEELQEQLNVSDATISYLVEFIIDIFEEAGVDLDLTEEILLGEINESIMGASLTAAGFNKPTRGIGSMGRGAPRGGGRGRPPVDPKEVGERTSKAFDDEAERKAAAAYHAKAAASEKPESKPESEKSSIASTTPAPKPSEEKEKKPEAPKSEVPPPPPPPRKTGTAKQPKPPEPPESDDDSGDGDNGGSSGQGMHAHEFGFGMKQKQKQKATGGSSSISGINIGGGTQTVQQGVRR